MDLPIPMVFFSSSTPAIMDRFFGLSGCQNCSLNLAAQHLQPCDISHSTMVQPLFLDTVRAVQASEAAKL